MLKRKALVVLVLGSVFSLCSLMHGQANGVLSGTVADKTGSVIAGATVKITSQGTGLTREVKTDGSGHYTAPFLPVAFYTIRVESQGFQTAEQKDLRLQVDERREVDFSLNPASVSQSVEVSATEVAVETSNPTLGQVITAEQVADLPLNGRDFVQLATLTPGTTQETSTQSFFNAGPSSEVSARGTFSLSVGGSRASSTDWLFDGNDNNELTAGGIAILPSVDAIQEFKVLTYNYSAEFGTRAGPTVLVTSKAGTNQFHGSVFEYFRNTSLDAAFSFPKATPKFNLNQFGFAVGGPIQKDKTFFFADYEAKRQRKGVPFVGLVPTQDMLNGDFTNDPFGVARPGVFDYSNNPTNNDGFGDLINPYTNTAFQCDGSGTPIPTADGTQSGGVPCNKISVATRANGGMADPVGLAVVNLYTPSNTSNAGGGYNYTNVPVRRLNEGKFDVRLDHTFSNKDSIFARFSYDQANSFIPGGSPGFAEQGAFSSTQNISNHGRNAAISETHVFNDHNINQVTVGYNRIFNHILSFGDRSCEAQKLGILGADLNSLCGAQPPGIVNQTIKDCMSCGMTSIQLLTGYWSLGDRGFAPFTGGTNVFTFNDSFDMIRGKHDIRVGLGFRANQMNTETNAFQDGFFLVGNGGTFTGDGIADLLIGQVGGAIHDQTYLGATTGRRWKMFRPFVEDDWRVTPSLTLNLGLAWALVTPVSEVKNRMANFVFAGGGSLNGKYLVAGPPVPGCMTCVHSDAAAGVQFDKTAVEPRIGLAWKVLGSQRTALRAGYAIFHDSSWNQGAQGLWMNPPYLAESDNFNYFPGLPCPFIAVNCGVSQAFLPTLPPFSTFNPDTFQGTALWQNLNFKQGIVEQFNFNLEEQLPGQIVLTAGYAGSRGHHLLISGLGNVNLNSPMACAGSPTGGAVPGYTLGCGPGGQFVQPAYGGDWPNFKLIGQFNDYGNATYNGLQIKAETKSARHGLYALVGYTYSHTYDSGLPDNLGTPPGAMYWPLPGTQKADWAHSQINLDHQFTASVIYDLPFGKGKAWGSNWTGPANAAVGNWQVTVIERVTSGFPLFLTNSNNGPFSGSGVNFQWNGSSLNRPDQVGDPNKGGPEGGRTDCPAKVHTIQSWFNPCAFAPAAPGELGNANRAPVNGPDFINTDLSLIKQFRMTERVGLTFRAEFFNVFNHLQLGLLGNSLTFLQDLNSRSTLAKVNETVHDPRVIQFALRLTF
jgi:Carboxypeptidase regulatory-like domain